MANYGVVSEPERSDVVTAQGFRNSLRTLTNSKWWQRIETANEVAGNLNNELNG
jgi:hypothetical protein